MPRTFLHNKPWILFWSILAAGVFLFTTGCVNRSGQPDNSATTASHSKDPQDFFVVDCLLPGEVRQLGQTFTFLAPRRAIKTTAFDCGLRGGEFTAYDRANYKTALSVWLPQAQQGDPEAQTYVGEIYEKGLGVAPDYAVAANWYAKASEQGSPRAQINLGYLYEKGLGVDQDVPKALNLYRNASGLTNDNLTFESTVEIETQARIGEARKEIEALRRNFQKSRLEAEKLRSKLASYESRLSTQRNRLDEALDELEKTRRDTKLLESTPSKDPQSSRTFEQQKEQLAKAQSHVLEERNRVKRLEQQFQRETTSLSTRLEATETKTDAYRQEILQSQPVRSQAYTVDATMLKKRQEEARTLTAKHTKAANDLRNQIYQGLDDLEAAQHQLASVQEDPSPRKQVISGYQIEIDKKQAGVLLQRAKLTKLETRYRAELKALKAEISLLERSQGLFADIGSQNFDHLPKITLLDPSLSAIKTRGRNHLAVKLRSVSGSHEILGRAEAFAGIKTLRLNNRALAIDDSAVFKTNIRVARQETPVNITLVDKAGNRATLDFVMIRSTALTTHESTGQTTNVGRIESGIDFGSYHALLIGNENYSSLPKLDTPIADVNEIGAILRNRYGFKTTVITNANRYAMLSALNTLRTSLGEDTSLLIYYAGHGEIDRFNQKGQWLPVDAEPDSSVNWISSSAITDIINSMSVRHVMVIADSCYSGAMTQASVARLNPKMSVEKKIAWLKTMALGRSRTVLTSGGTEPVLDSGAGGHSVFANAFMQTLRQNIDILEGQSLYWEISGTVQKESSRIGFEQSPRYGPIRHAGHEASDFFFVPAS